MKLFGPFKQLLTLDGLPQNGPVEDDALVVIQEGGIITDSELIFESGVYNELAKRFPEAIKEEAGRGLTVIPGFIDAHTHLCWHSDRVLDYSFRVAGKSYLEIAEAGGGIWSSVLKTREAPGASLVAQTVSRANRHLQDGVTTIEVKSGYGLSVRSELKMLHSIAEANQRTSADLISTCLAAHMKPRDFDGSDRAYLELLIDELLPEIQRQNLSERIDIFIEKTAFGAEDGAFYLNAAREMGFSLTVHADQFSVGGSAVAVACGADSADHLEASGAQEIENIATSDTTSIALPGASLGLGMRFTPARKILDAGGKLAIASDWNPGSAPMGDLLMQAAVLGAYEKLSIAETLAGLTTRAAEALRLSDRGTLTKGKLADFQGYRTDDYRSIFYHQGRLKPVTVWKKGAVASFGLQ